MVRLVSVEVLFPSLARHSGLRIWYCRRCGVGHSSGLDLIPGPGTSIGCGYSKKKKKKKKKRAREKREMKLGRLQVTFSGL